MFGLGKKVEVEVPDGRGGTIKVKVWETQFDQWVAEGREIKKVEGFKAHISDPVKGHYEENWVIGEQISKEDYDNFRDGNGEIYVWVIYEGGEPNINFVRKEMWDKED